MDTDRRPTFRAIVAVFARYANFTLGGGSATIAVLHEQLVTRRRWISELQFQLAYALSRLTPGTNLLAFCTGVGWMTRRWRGAIVALTAASVPCSMMAVAATHFFEVLRGSALFAAALRGALAAAVAVMVNTAWVLAGPHVKASTTKAAVIVPGAIALVSAGSLSPFHVLLIAACVGLLWPAREIRE